MKKNLLFITGLFLLLNVYAQCPSTSVVGGHIIYDDISVSPLAWNNLAGAESSDNNRTTSGQNVLTNTTVNTSGLWAQVFMFNVPSYAVICGVEVRIEHRQVGAVPGTSSVNDQFVQLISNMTVVGTNHAMSSEWNSTDQVDIYGGPGDLWGLNLTPADVNASDFGVAMGARLQNTGAMVNLSAQVDKVSLMVYYSTPLPVELEDFHAETDGRNVDLLWQIASETNNAEFMIERSIDAIHWTQIGTVAGGGTHNDQTNYNFLDQTAPNGTLYYNLKQRDHNGEVQHLGSTTITFNKKEELDLQYNPSSSTVQIFGLTDQSNSQLNILNVSGKTIFTSSTSADQDEVMIDHELSSGIYFFEVMSGEKKVVKKIFVD